MSKNEQMQTVLLKEYETARSTCNQFESNMWQTAAVFIIASLAGVSILFTLTEHSWTNLIGVTGIGLISIFILWYWSGTVDRWLSLDAVLLHRMREIETELGMWTQRYTQYLDRTRIYKQQYKLEPNQRKRFSKLDEEIPHYATVPNRVRIRFLIFVLALGWIILIVRELMLTLTI
jgi:hypothetical protein